MKKPNIVHIFVDQQRFDTIGALNNPVIKTPNLNRLVKSGIAFTNAYSPSPVCIAARCSMIYGQYPCNTGCYENTVMPEDSRKSFMEELSRSGYKTHGIGKCHFSPDKYAMRGFDSREIQEEIGAETLENEPYLQYLYNKGYDYLLEPNGVRGEMYYIPQISQLPAKDHPTQWVGDRSVEFINNQKKSNRPWYLFSSYIHPHPPFAPPNPWHKLYRPSMMPLPNIPAEYESLLTFVNKCQNRYKYRDNGFDKNLVRAIKAYYYACISFVDYQVGRLLDALQATGQIENTMIIFTADHGEHLGDYQSFGKRSMHDSCARIPMLISQPGRFDGGRVFDLAVSLVDIAPTILGAADIKTTTHEYDGIDLFDFISGRIEREYVFGQLSFEGATFLKKDHKFISLLSEGETNKSLFSTYMAASSRFKYFYSAPDRKEILFNKTNDPKETRNVVSSLFLKRQLEAIKSSLIDFLKENGETAGIKDDDFIRYNMPDFIEDPDAGQIIQDGYTPWGNSEIKGYSE